MPEIILGDEDRLDWALKVFKRRMQTSGILRELRRRRHYVKPSAARLIKSRSAQRARDKARRNRRESR
ncbi:MAG TPA: 30S ribosomal protein S21 [Gemmatimonadaceae bacterium]|nr:30S ribosomal protein S21 [Gemmatimonadaceae bacterium]